MSFSIDIYRLRRIFIKVNKFHYFCSEKEDDEMTNGMMHLFLQSKSFGFNTAEAAELPPSVGISKDVAFLKCFQLPNDPTESIFIA